MEFGVNLQSQHGRVGFLVKTYPKLSETFVLEEIIGLERAGLELNIFSLRQPTDEMTHAAVKQVKARVAYATGHGIKGWWQIVVSHVSTFAANPAGYARALAFSLRPGRDASIKQFVQAGALVPQLRAASITHLHVHFASEPASVAEIIECMSGIRFSLSAHAKDIYLARPADLTRKLGHAQFTVTCTEYNREHLAKLAPPKAIVKRMYHGIDLARFAPAAAVQDTRNTVNPPLIVSVGRLREKKGFGTLIEACRQLRDQGVVFRCQIIGYGEDRARLQQLITDYQLEAVVELLGKLTQDKVIECYRAATLFALPCQVGADGDRDGIPNVLLEAMAMELPVVSTAISGIPEVISHDRNGLLVPAQNPAALAQAMRSVIEDSPLRIRLGVAARTKVAEQFSNDSNLLQLRQLLAQATMRAPSVRAGDASAREFASPDAGAEIAYVLKGFPRLSETFIAHEIHLLEIMGKRLRLFVIKQSDEAKVHEVVGRIKAPINYLPEFGSISGCSLWRWLSGNFASFKVSHGKLIAARPGLYAKTLFAALGMSIKYRQSGLSPMRKVFIKEFVQAGMIAGEVLAAPNIKHLHGHFCHGATTVTWFVSQLTGIPFSFTAHAKDIYQADQNPGDLLLRKMRAARFVTTCTAANHEFLLRAGPACGHVHTVYHGLDTEYFAPPARTDTNANAVPHILTVGRFVEKKGFDYLIEACAQLRRKGLHFHCTLVGECGDQSERIAGMIAARQLDDVVEIRNAVTQTELRGIYARATMFVLPCLVTADGDRDGIPNVLAEAMAMGLPIVSTNISGIPELVDDGIDGLLVPEQDGAALANAMHRLMSDETLRHRLGSAARTKIVNRFDSRRTTLKLKGLFTDAMREEETGDALAAIHS
jgi:glycosyltransferase involved in cell wall biosynthesis